MNINIILVNWVSLYLNVSVFVYFFRTRTDKEDDDDLMNPKPVLFVCLFTRLNFISFVNFSAFVSCCERAILSVCFWMRTHLSSSISRSSSCRMITFQNDFCVYICRCSNVRSRYSSLFESFRWKKNLYALEMFIYWRIVLSNTMRCLWWIFHGVFANHLSKSMVNFNFFFQTHSF